MKTVFDNREVVHVWASQQQAEGKSLHIFFEGPSIYSYGHHFEMARFINPNTVFVTTRGYSVTTQKHLSFVRGSLASFLNVFHVPSFDNHQENFQHLLGHAMDLRTKTIRARRHADWLSDQTTEAVSAALRYVQLFPKSAYKLPHLYKLAYKEMQAETFLSAEAIEQAKTRAAKARQELSERTKAKNAEREQREQAALADWLAGNDNHRYFQATMLRVKGDEVQTTKGASVPVIEARKLYRAMKAGVLQVGHRVGLFTVNAIGPTTPDITIGCHVIPIAEIERIAPQVMNHQHEVVNA